MFSEISRLRELTSEDGSRELSDFLPEYFISKSLMRFSSSSYRIRSRRLRMVASFLLRSDYSRLIVYLDDTPKLSRSRLRAFSLSVSYCTRAWKILASA